MADQLRVTRPFILLTTLIAPLGAAGLLMAWTVGRHAVTLPLLLLVAATLLSENFAFSLPDYSVSLSYPLAMAAIVVGGPAAAGLVAAMAATNYREIRAHRPLVFILFNFGQASFVWTTGAYLYVHLGGSVLSWTADGTLKGLQSGDFPKVLLPMLVAAVYCAAGNIFLTSLAAAALGIQSLKDQSRAMFAFMPTQVALAFVGYLIAQVIALNVVALPLFIAPLIVARQLYVRYADLKSAYVDTIRSLIGALEAKDPYTRGHSERVSEYALRLGQEVGLEPRALERLEYAGLLHDLGKLAVPSRVLTNPGRLQPHEMDWIREHPARGAMMVGRIPPLRDLAETVGQHHERVDGTGYPARIDGAALTQAARILAVADSYDAMTTTRAYRPALSHREAVAELLAGSGSQFDANLVRVFLDAEIGIGVEGEVALELVPASSLDAAVQGGEL
jgi:HD-GYP domain-containing protein (c-di-GMP phosphodiesterase class II)